MNYFLECNKYIDFKSKIIISKSEQLFSADMSNVQKAQIVYTFVRDDIPHSFDCIALMQF